MTAEELVDFAEGLAVVAAAGGGARAYALHLAERLGAGVRVGDAAGRALATVGPSRNGVAISAPIAAGPAVLGAIEAGVESSPEALLALRLTAAAIAVELARERGGSTGRRRAFWERLRAGGYHDFAAARADAQANGMALATHYVAIALEPPEVAGIVATTFASGEFATGILERESGVLVLAPAAREIDAANARTAASLLPKTAAKSQPDCVASGGVANPVPAIEIARGIAAAEAALAIGRRVYGAGRVLGHDDLGAYALLFDGADGAALRAFAAATLAPLRAYDERHQTELVATLRSYFSNGQNVKDAAAELHVHRHTVFYRLRQIGEICGRTLDSPHDQLTFRMAIAIDALHT